ncbi:hypothetical protein AYO39_00350 [Actinobacteria bacterium SCGC AG-212-D09]|nr:hypothetical protein AYO39_00350 [Actinobacteria bacterium SCGC AG-212-D09]
MIGTAVAVLVGATAAYAAFNNYQGTKLTFHNNQAGSSKHPHGFSMAEHLQANAPAGDRAAPLFNIKVTIYGVKLDAGKLPTCSDAKIEQNKVKPTGACPTGSLIGNGLVNSLLGPGTDPSASKGTACNPHLNVFNGGPSTQVFYFYTNSSSDCGGLTTGSTAPYDGHISYKNGNAIVNIPLPPDISTKVAGQPNFYGSLIKETINFPTKVNGKGYMTSIKCKNGKRPWSVQYEAKGYSTTGGATETQTVSGSQPC